MDQMLQNIGIECNYVNKTWTGVSLERYKYIIRALNSDLTHPSSHIGIGFQFENSQNNTNNNNNQFPKFTLLTILSYLWETANSKQCLLDFLLSIEQSSGMLLINNEFSFLRDNSSLKRKEWIESKYDINLLYSKEIIQNSVDILQHFILNPGLIFYFSMLFVSKYLSLNNNCNNNVGTVSIEDQPAYCEALELIIVSLLNEKIIKTPLKLGRYSYKGGQQKPDCVEVVIREILDNIFYGESIFVL